MIAIGCDHAGYELKEKIKEYLDNKNIVYKDFGTFSKESCDYPDYAKKVAKSVASNESKKGVLICGSGIGISIAANKVSGIRAALCYEPNLAQMAREHNDANILCLGARVTDLNKAIKILDTFLNTDFEGKRHQRRIEKISEIEIEEYQK